LDLGADDYITKPFNPQEVVARVRALLRRSNLERGVIAPQVLKVGALRLDLGRRELTTSGQPVELTPTEYNLLRILMESPGYAFTRDELLEKGLGYAYAGMGRILDSHIKNLRRKIEPNPKKPTYIQTIYGVGYRLEGSVE
ncbi:MAG: response regulator transcription factor, partial [Anaerolineales bacterium]|nr:response regulator transcription factor [Anaerolineales bacterium]